MIGDGDVPSVSPKAELDANIVQIVSLKAEISARSAPSGSPKAEFDASIVQIVSPNA